MVNDICQSIKNFNKIQIKEDIYFVFNRENKMKILKSDLNRVIRQILKEEIQLRKLNEAAIEAKLKGNVNIVYEILVKGGHIQSGDTLLIIDGQKQAYTLREGSKVIRQGKVSTAAKGFGNQPDSERTSTGLMRVVGFGGKGAPKGSVLVGLNPVNPPIILGPNQDSPRAKQGHAAEVLTRAIVLEGLEEHNRNVKSRNIYIHGTNRENRLGVQASGGCIRVSNDDAIALADTLMKIGDYVYVFTGALITENDKKITGKQRLKSLLEQDQALDKTDANKEYNVDGKPASEEEAFKVLSKYPEEKNA